MQKSAQAWKTVGRRVALTATSHLHTWREDATKVPDNYTEGDLQSMVSQQLDCRRTIIGEVLDGRPTLCTVLSKPNLCDNCESQASIPIGGTLGTAMAPLQAPTHGATGPYLSSSHDSEAQPHSAKVARPNAPAPRVAAERTPPAAATPAKRKATDEDIS